MKIALASYEYSRRGGLPRYATQIATGLRERGHSITVFSHSFEKTPRDDQIEFNKYETWDWSHLTRMVSEPRVLTRLFKRISPSYDACISVGLPCKAPVALIGMRPHRAWYRASTSHDLGGSKARRLLERVRPFHRPILASEASMFRAGFPERVIVPTDTAARDYIELFNFPQQRIRIVPCGVETEEFRFSDDARVTFREALDIAPSVKVIATVAARGRQKGIDLLLNALSHLRTDVPWRCIVAGSVSPSVRSQVEPLRIDGKISILGHQQSLIGLYCGADVFVLPSRFDPWGLVLTESLACGTPVLSSPAAGASIAVQEGVNGGIIRKLNDAGSFADDIESLLTSQFDRGQVASSVDWLDLHETSAQLEAALFS